MHLKNENFALLFKQLIDHRDINEFRRYERLIVDYIQLLHSQQDYRDRIREYSNLNEQAISKITAGIYTSNEAIAMQKDKLEEYSKENKMLTMKLVAGEETYHQTKEKLVEITTKYEIISEDVDDLKQENHRLTVLLSNEKEHKQQLADEHKVLQSTLIAHEREIFALKEENELLLSELLRQKEKQIDEVLRGNELEKKLMLKSKKTSQTSSKTEINTLEQFGSFCPTRVAKKINLNDDIYDIRVSKSYAGISTGDNVAVYKLKPDFSYYGILKGCTGVVNSVDINSSESQILTGSSDHSCKIWNIKECKLADSLMGHTDKVLTAKFSPYDSNRVISGGKDRNIKQWDTVSLSCLTNYYIPSSCIDLAVTTSYTGLSAHLDKCCRMWDLRSKHISNSVTIPDKITSLVYAANTFAVCSRNNNIYLYDMRNLKPTIFSNNYLSVAFDWTKIGMSPDGRYIVAGSRTAQVLVWNVTKDCHILDGHSYPVVCTSWSDQGSNILSADSRRNVFLWQ